jgi:hypothetical protein
MRNPCWLCTSHVRLSHSHRFGYCWSVLPTALWQRRACRHCDPLTTATLNHLCSDSLIPVFALTPTLSTRFNMLGPSFVGLLALSSVASAGFFSNSFNDGQVSIQTTDDRTNPVAGENPLEFCASPDDYLLTIDSVDLSPNPPVA